MGWLRLPLAMALSCLALILPGVRPARIQADQPSGVTLEATAGFGGLARVARIARWISAPRRRRAPPARGPCCCRRSPTAPATTCR
jgi:hypothetical protein